MIVLAFDTETTGLVPNLTVRDEILPEIVEVYLGLVDLADGGRVITEIDTLIKPSRGIDEWGKAATIHKITNAMIKDAPPFSAVAPKIKELIESAPLVVGHNATFDKEVISVEASRSGSSIKWPRLLCTVEQTMYLKGHRLSLAALHEMMVGEPHAGGHRAKADVMALVRCLVKMRERDMI